MENYEKILSKSDLCGEIILSLFVTVGNGKFDPLIKEVDRLKGAGKIKGEVIIEKGAVVKNSTIRGPAIIGSETEIVHSYIGPFTSIQNRCKIIQTEVEHSIILEGSEIRDIGSRIDESLIGREVKIFKSPPKPSVYRFMVGDKSEIDVK